MFNVFFAFFLLGSAISANKVILFTMSPALLVGIRMLIAGLILFIYTILHSHHNLQIQKIKNNILLILLVTLSTTFFPSLLKAYSLKTMTSSKASFFGVLDPFVTAIFAYFLFGEKLNFSKVIGILFGCIGALVLLSSTSNVEEQLKAFYIFSYPELAALFAVIISRFGWILIQKLLKENLFSAPQINTLTMLLSGILSLISAGVYSATSIGSLQDAPFSILQKAPFVYWSPNTQLLVFLIYTIIVGNVLGYTIYASVLKKYSATFISLAGFSIPLSVYFYGWLFLSEPLSLNFIIACLITFIGLLIFYNSEK